MKQVNKYEIEAKMAKEKRENERRKNILVLITRYLINMGYADAAFSLQEQAKLNLDCYDVADNIDLYIILCDFEEYFELRFNKKPKFVTKLAEFEAKLPSIKLESRSGADREKRNIQSKAGKKGTNLQKTKADGPQDSKKTGEQELKLELVGQNMNKTKTDKEKTEEKFTFEDQKESILLKPIPDNFFGNQELKELAGLVRREIIVEDPNVKFDDIIGLKTPKSIINEALVLPMEYPQFFTGILEPWKGILLFGPPGTGKTLLAKAVATEMRCTFFNISAATIVSKWRGDSEKIIKILFDLARYYQPSVIFLDEIDSIMSRRGGSSDEHEGSRRMKTELLIQLDGLSKRESERVFLLAASNLPWDLDSALLRRLEKRVIVDLPDKDARVAMLKLFIPEDKQTELDYAKYGELLEGYSGSDIKLVCKEALMKGVRRVINHLQPSSSLGKDKRISCNSNKIELTTNKDLEEALAKTRPASIYKAEQYVAWMNSYGSF